MKRLVRIAVIIILVLMVSTSCSKNENNEVIELTISAAASMEGALKILQKEYEAAHGNVKLYFNFGSSGSLQQQILQGAPVDLFLSASKDKFDLLVEKELIDRTDSIDLIKNELVLIQNKQAKDKLNGFADLGNDSVQRLSIGTPESVPAGAYAKETLENLGLWNSLEERFIFAKDVRQVLTYVETENVDAGIVYKTDAMDSQKIEIIEVAPANSHSPIIYPLGIIKTSKQKEEAKNFYEYLQSDEAKMIFKKFGFKFLTES
jgi:molybdate transport system substrate-binding protein